MSQATQGQDAGKLFTPSTKISRYDQVSSLLVAMTILIGVICLVLFAVWLTTITRVKSTQAAVEWNDDLMGNNNNPEGIAEDFEEPGVEELAEVPEPQLADAIEAVTDAVSTQQASLEATEGNAAQQGTGTGLGDRRERGPGNGGDRRDKPWDRWEIRYTTNSRTEYAKQLDAFGIELGAISRRTPEIRYLSNVSTTPQQRAGTKSLERRIFFAYPSSNPLRQWDEEFFNESGFDTSESVLVQFYSVESQRTLLELERQASNNLSPDEIQRTIFAVRSGAQGFEYYVVDVVPRR